MTVPTPAQLDALLNRLTTSLAIGASENTILKHWSAFVRARDRKRCVPCGSEESPAAHHICRKSFFAAARFQTGNGITLCRHCHKRAHAGSNGRPDLELPMDAQGGEKVELLAKLFAELADAQSHTDLADEKYYWLDDAVLGSFKQFQCLDPAMSMRGTRVRQAAGIWNMPSLVVVDALIRANLPDI